MKTYLITTSVSLLLVLALSLAAALVGRSATDEFQGETDALEALVRKQDWDQAAHRCDALITKWDARQTSIEIFVQHSDTEEIVIDLQSLKVALEEREALHALIYLAELREGFGHIENRDALTLSNIL